MRLPKIPTLLLAISGMAMAGGNGTLRADSWANALPENETVLRDSSLQFSSAKIDDERPGLKILHFSITARPGAVIQPDKVTVLVYLYERSDHGDIVATKSEVTSAWPSLPIDWAGEATETVKFSYHPPGAKADRKTAPGSAIPKFHGCVAGLYYAGDLVATYSKPKELEREFPIRLQLSLTRQ